MAHTRTRIQIFMILYFPIPLFKGTKGIKRQVSPSKTYMNEYMKMLPRSGGRLVICIGYISLIYICFFQQYQLSF